MYIRYRIGIPMYRISSRMSNRKIRRAVSRRDLRHQQLLAELVFTKSFPGGADYPACWVSILIGRTADPGCFVCLLDGPHSAREG